MRSGMVIQKKIGNILSDYLEKAISYYDYSESFYHAFVTGLFSATKYRVVSNRESGNGRSGLLIIDINNKRVAVFEFKIAKTENSIEKKLHEGILQIEDKTDASDFSRYRIFKYCVTFCQRPSGKPEGLDVSVLSRGSAPGLPEAPHPYG